MNDEEQTIQKVMEHVSFVTGVKPSRIGSRNRTTSTVNARFLFVLACHELGVSTKAISKAIRRKVNSINVTIYKARTYLNVDRHFALQYNEIKERLNT